MKTSVAGLAVFTFLSVVSSPAFAQTTSNYRTFADWCVNKASLPADARHTVEVLLEKAGTQNCQQANQKLSTLTVLSLDKNQISNLQPLSSLTELTVLVLSFNQINNLQPLSGLTKFRILDLSINPTLTNKTCPVKPASICKF